MALDRNKFKATSTKKLKVLKEEEDKIIGSGQGGLETLDIVDGMNKIRIAPKFPDEKEFYLMTKRTWIPYEKEDGQITNIPVLDSKVHGGTKLDIIEEYFNYVKNSLDSSDSDDAEKLKKLTHWKDGLVAQIFWTAYGWKLVKGQEPEFGFFEFKRTIRDELCSLSIIEDEDEAIELDPFTCPDEGSPILVTYNSKAKKSSDYYKLKLSKNQYPLTDEMFEEFSTQKPLSELLRNVYTREDFDKALEGLRMYDSDNELDLIDEDEFQEIMIEVRGQYGSSKAKAKEDVDEDEDEDEEEAPKPKKNKKPAPKPEPEEEEDEDEDEEEAPKPKKNKKPVVEEEDEDEEEEAPKKKKKPTPEPEEEDEDEEEAGEEEEAPKKKSKLSIAELREKLAEKKKK